LNDLTPTRTTTSIPLFAASLDRYQERISERLTAVAASGRYILGPEVSDFEQEFAEYVGARHCIGVANGTDALTLALRAIGVRPGDEVVMP
jgi:dTDP-3-amino-3,4,6-trideoxy-alpha-D-glucose transaminase